MIAARLPAQPTVVQLTTALVRDQADTAAETAIHARPEAPLRRLRHRRREALPRPAAPRAAASTEAAGQCRQEDALFAKPAEICAVKDKSRVERLLNPALIFYIKSNHKTLGQAC